jgi:hypothetical protein
MRAEPKFAPTLSGMAVSLAYAVNVFVWIAAMVVLRRPPDADR